MRQELAAPSRIGGLDQHSPEGKPHIAWTQTGPVLYTCSKGMNLSTSRSGRHDENSSRVTDRRYGLGGGILSGDEDRALEMAKKHFDTGMVFINTYGVADPKMPFGGVKNSGYGREHGGLGVKEFANAKSIFVGAE